MVDTLLGLGGLVVTVTVATIVRSFVYRLMGRG